jgi:hypothetical protein
MDAISSVQTIGQSASVVTDVPHLDVSQGIQSATSNQSLSIDDVSSTPLKINLSNHVEAKDLNIVESLMQGVSEIDADYQGIMNRLNSWPNFGSYLEKQGVIPQNQMNQSAGITHVSNVDALQSTMETSEPLSIEQVLDEKQIRMEELQKEQQAYYSAGIEYTQDSTLWSMNSTFWLSKIKILTSAVSEVSQGLRTLFTSQ